MPKDGWSGRSASSALPGSTMRGLSPWSIIQRGWSGGCSMAAANGEEEDGMSNDAETTSNQEAAEADANPLAAELAKAKAELLRALAEVENTRRRADRQSQEARAYAIDRFARDLLPVADTLTRAIAAVPPHWRESADE